MFQTRLRELRESAGFKSQQAFADAFGVAQSTVGNWEAGKREPNYETTMRLARFFGVSIDNLLGLEIKKDPAPVTEGGSIETIQRFMPLVDRLTPDQQQLLLAQLQAWTKQNGQPASAVPHSNEETAPESDS